MAGYELKKIWLKRHGFIWLLMALAVQAVISFVRYDTAYLNFDMESEKAYFLQYVQAYAGMDAEQAYDAVQEEFGRLQRVKEQASDALKEYEADEIGKQTFLDTIAAEQSAKHQRTAIQPIFEQVKRMRAGQPQEIQYTNGWSVLLNRGSPSILLLLLIGILVVPVICAEYRTEMLPFLHSAKNGQTRLLLSKLIAVLVSAVFSVTVLEMTELICISVRYGLPDGSVPVQSISYLEACPWNLTAVQAFGFRLVLLMLGGCYLAVLLLYLTLKLKRSVPALLAGFGITLFPLWMFTETKYPYILPLPLGLLKAAGYLQGSFRIRLTEISLTEGEICGTIAFSCIITVLLAAVSILSVRLHKKTIVPALLCMVIFTGCGAVNPDTHFIFNSAEIRSYHTNSDYAVSLNADGSLTVSDRKNDIEMPLLHNAFLRGHTILYPSWYIHDTFVYRLETEYENASDNTSVITDRVIRTNLPDFRETVLYEETLMGNQNGNLLGMEQYIPMGYGQTDSAVLFAVSGDYIVLESHAGLYLSVKGSSRKPLVDEAVREWGIRGNMLYYISENYFLHSFNLDTREDNILSDCSVNKLAVSKNGITAFPINQNEELMLSRTSYADCMYAGRKIERPHSRSFRKDQLYKEPNAKYKNLSRAKADMDEYLRPERSQEHQRRQSWGDLE